jgi:hypothetical protein
LLAAIPVAAYATQDLILHLEDGSGNAITDADVVHITSAGDHLKADLLPDGTYACYDVGEKFTVEIEHDSYGMTRLEMVSAAMEVPKDPPFSGGPVHRTVVLGQARGGHLPAQDPPVNDLCEDAIPVAVPSVTSGTTEGAGMDWPDAPDCGTYITSPGVWYSVVGTGNTMTATTCGDFYGYDTKISVYCRGCDDLYCIGGNDDYCYDGASFFLSTFIWCSEPGVEYLILVHGYGGASGPFELQVYDDGVACVPDIICPARPANDFCEDAIAIDVPSVTMGTTEGADIDWPYAPDCGAAIITSPGVWYRVIGDGSTLTATTCSEFYGYDTKLSVYCGECGDFICIDGNDDDCDLGYPNMFLSTVTWCTQATAEYLILVHGFGGQYGEFELTVSSDGVPCTGAVACLPVGACCFPDASCANGMTQYDCEMAGGTYQGDDTACEGGFLGWGPFEDCANPFEDISGTGTALYLGDDDGEIVPIGFSFNFWGYTHAEIGVCSNGYLTFGDDLYDYSNDAIPDDYDPNDFIAPLWDDLSPNQGGTVHYQTLGVEPNRRFIAQWTNVPQFYAGDSNTFQAILFEGTNCIEFRYGVFTPEGYAGDYTIGVESPDGFEGVDIAGSDVYEGDCFSICPMFSDPIVCPLKVPFDIKPTSCPNPLNTRSNGVVPVAILGADDFDVYDVDPASILLEGVAPLRWSYEDVATPFGGDLCDCSEEGPDGYMDLTLKFDTQELVAALGVVTDGEYRPLMFEGAMYDAYPIYGEDCVWIKDKGNDPDPPQVISIDTFSGSSSVIHLSLDEPTQVSVAVYDVRGKLVRTVVDGTLPSGSHSISWNGKDQAGKAVADGVYFCRVKVGTIEETVKMLMMK